MTNHENMRPALIDDGKGKVHPIADYESPEGECKYICALSVPLSLHGGGGWSVGPRHAPADLPPGMTRCPLYPRLGGS